MRDSISSIANMQYDELTLYSGSISVARDITEDELSILDEKISSLNGVSRSVLATAYSANITVGENELSGFIQIYKNDESLKQANVVKSPSDNTELYLDNNSVLINEKMSELLSVDVGDSISIESADGSTASVKVGGIFKKYINHEIYISQNYYETLFSDIPLGNTIQIANSLSSEDTLQEQILNTENVDGVIFNSTVVSNFDNITNSLNIVIIVIIISAASLAFVVLGNLASINIGERKREIATLKVLGLSHKETKSYIFKENVALTVFGVIFGIILGIVAHNFIITQIEMDFLMFVRTVSIQSVLYSVLLTFIFSIVVNKFMLAKLKKIDMIESLKSVE